MRQASRRYSVIHLGAAPVESSTRFAELAVGVMPQAWRLITRRVTVFANGDRSDDHRAGKPAGEQFLLWRACLIAWRSLHASLPRRHLACDSGMGRRCTMPDRSNFSGPSRALRRRWSRVWESAVRALGSSGRTAVAAARKCRWPDGSWSMAAIAAVRQARFARCGPQSPGQRGAARTPRWRLRR